MNNKPPKSIKTARSSSVINLSSTQDLHQTRNSININDSGSKVLFKRFYNKFSNNVENTLTDKNSNSVQLIGNHRFSNSSVKTFIDEKRRGSLYNKFNPEYIRDIEILKEIDSKAFDEKEDNIELLKQYRDKRIEILNKIELTPIPIQNKIPYDKREERNIQKAKRSAVIMRRYEYGGELDRRKSLSRRSSHYLKTEEININEVNEMVYFFRKLNLIKKIQLWWKNIKNNNKKLNLEYIIQNFRDFKKEEFIKENVIAIRKLKYVLRIQNWWKKAKKINLKNKIANKIKNNLKNIIKNEIEIIINKNKTQIIKPIFMNYYFATKFNKINIIPKTILHPINLTKLIKRIPDLEKLVKIQNYFRMFLFKLKYKIENENKIIFENKNRKVLNIPKIKTQCYMSITRKKSTLFIIIKLQNKIKIYLRKIKFSKLIKCFDRLPILYYSRKLLSKLYINRINLELIFKLNKICKDLNTNQNFRNNILIEEKLKLWKNKNKQIKQNEIFKNESCYNYFTYFNFDNNENFKKLSYKFISHCKSSQMIEVENKKETKINLKLENKLLEIKNKISSQFSYQNKYNFLETPYNKIINYKFESKLIRLVDTKENKITNNKIDIIIVIKNIIPKIKNIFDKNIKKIKFYFIDKINEKYLKLKSLGNMNQLINNKLRSKLFINLKIISDKFQFKNIFRKYNFKLLINNFNNKENIIEVLTTLNKNKLPKILNKISILFYKKNYFNKILFYGIYQTSDYNKSNILNKIIKESFYNKNHTQNIFDFFEEYSRIIKGYNNSDRNKINENNFEILSEEKIIPNLDLDEDNTLKILNRNSMIKNEKNPLDISLYANNYRIMDNSYIGNSGRSNNHFLVSRNETITLSDYDEFKFKKINLNTSNISII